MPAQQFKSLFSAKALLWTILQRDRTWTSRDKEESLQILCQGK